jgi:hypothetical protein
MLNTYLLMGFQQFYLRTPNAVELSLAAESQHA